MSAQPRVAKVLAALLVSMTVGAIVLMALSGKPPSAGPFSLSSYIGLDPVKEAVRSQAKQQANRWEGVEVYYSGTKTGNIEQLASLSGLAGAEDLNCHFVVCNGLGGGNGQIMSTEKWQNQWSAIPGRNWHGNGRTIRICVVADGANTRPTEYQIKRAYALVDRLCRSFVIQPKSIRYPDNWQ
jgi:hypothetical protein